MSSLDLEIFSQPLRINSGRNPAFVSFPRLLPLDAGFRRRDA